MEARWYQDEAAEALLTAINSPGLVDDEFCHPVIAIPTAGGKTFVICDTIDRFLSEHPSANVLVLSHVVDIIDQNHEALEDYFEMPIGLYAAGLQSRTIKKITVAQIQSCFRNPELFQRFSLILVDECHLVNHKAKGMYRTFLGSIDAVYAGFTATPFRLGHGYLHEGEGALFNYLAYDCTQAEKFVRMTHDGYLAKLITKGTKVELNPEGVKTQGAFGDFVSKALSQKLNRPELTRMAVAELVEFGKNYKKWLVFGIDIDHCEQINAELVKHGIKSEVVHSKMTGDRSDVMSRYKKGELDAVVNVNCLTTGLNVEDIDLIAMMRPSTSAVLHIQSIGRGLRPYPGKNHCLVLDFAGNIERLGPINDPIIKKPGNKTGAGTGSPQKRCPVCECHNPIQAKECHVCGHEFVFKTKLQGQASTRDVVRDRTTEKQGLSWHDVTAITYKLFQKHGRADSVQVTYHIGVSRVRSWVNVEEGGRPGWIAQNWMRQRLPDGSSVPESAQDLLRRTSELRKPSQVQVNMQSRWPQVKQCKFTDGKQKHGFRPLEKRVS